MDTFESLKKIWEECELAPIPQEAIQSKETEIFNLLNLPSDCVLPTIYLSKDRKYYNEDLFLIEWADQGLFCKFAPEWFELALVNSGLQTEKKFESDKFLEVLFQVVPLQSDVMTFKFWSEQKKSGYLVKMTMSTCRWIKIDDNEGCDYPANGEYFMGRFEVPQDYQVYLMPHEILSKFETGEYDWEVMILPGSIKLDDSKLQIKSGADKIVKILEGGETFNYFGNK